MIDIVIRYSELDTLTRCALQHRVIYGAGLQPPALGEALVRGSAFHALMQGWYSAFRDDDAAARPRDLAMAYARAFDALNEYCRGEGAGAVTGEMRELLIWMFDGYRGRWGTDADWSKILVVDERRLFPLVEYQDYRVILQCTADLVVWDRIRGQWEVIDHKTTARRDVSKAAFAKENQLDPQRGLYTAAYKLHRDIDGQDPLPIFAARHNSIRADRLQREMTPQERFARHPVYFGDVELATIWAEAQAAAIEALKIRFGLDGGGIRFSSPSPDGCRSRCGLKEPHLLARATGRDLVEVAREFGWRRPGDSEPARAQHTGEWADGGF